MTQQEIMKDWRDWMIAGGVRPEVADVLIRRGPGWCEFLWDAVHA